MINQQLEDALLELEYAVISENDRGWSGRGAEERTEAARQAIRDLVKNANDHT